MFQNSHFLLRAANYRVEDLRRRAAEDAVAEAIRNERSRARREAALASLKAAAAAKREQAVLGWQSQRQGFGVRSAR
ncbi:MAG TPA: hypothetical protein VFF08_07800 [Trueperaceae bacterium]|nr:hypothetical protein [Trueperaceae bacterium]